MMNASLARDAAAARAVKVSVKEFILVRVVMSELMCRWWWVAAGLKVTFKPIFIRPSRINGNCGSR